MLEYSGFYRCFIDIIKNIYSLSNDTKVISKIIELIYHVGASESNRHEMVEALVTNLPAVCSQNGQKIKQCVFSI